MINDLTLTNKDKDYLLTRNQKVATIVKEIKKSYCTD